MKITVTFGSNSAYDIKELREFLDRLDASLLPVLADHPAPPIPSAVTMTPPPPPPPSPIVVPPPPSPPAALHVPPGGGLAAGPAPAPPLVNAPAPELDVVGQPWDAALHAKSQTKTQDGKWRRKRGVSEAETNSAAVSAVLDPARQTPPPPPVSAPVSTPGTWEAVVHAIQARASKYSHEQIQGALREGGIEPTTLHSLSEFYGPAVAVLEARCPL